MKRNFLIALMFLTAAGFAAAQISTPSTDVLGAHLNYGRGCAACHAAAHTATATPEPPTPLQAISLFGARMSPVWPASPSQVAALTAQPAT